VRAKVVPVIMGATGTVSKSLRQYLSNVSVKHEIKELHKTTILGTAHKLREVLREKYRTYCTGEITLHVAQTVNTEQLQHCLPQKHPAVELTVSASTKWGHALMQMCVR